MPFRKPKVLQEVEFVAHVEPRGVNDWYVYLSGTDERGKAFTRHYSDGIKMKFQVEQSVLLEDTSEEKAHETAQQMVQDAYQSAQRKKLAFTVR